MNATIQSNSEFDELCNLTTKLFPQYGARPAAFKAACSQRPDLAAKAIDQTGHPVIQGTAKTASSGAGTAQAAPVAPGADDSLMRAVARSCEAMTARTTTEESVAGDPLQRACERRAGK
jgi:hypothetical protein